MKKLFLLIALTMTVMLGYAQDIITFRDGTSVKGHVSKITNSLVEYMDADSTKCAITKSQIFSINYANGSVDTFQDEQSQTYTLQDFNRDKKLRRLKVWSTILKVYGFINVASGIILVSNDNDDDNDTDDWSSSSTLTNKTKGTLCLIEGSAALVVGYCLSAKRSRLMREYNLVGSIPVISKEFKLNDNLSLTPSVNLMSYRNNMAEGVGAGLSVKF